jgi:glucokinase
VTAGRDVAVGVDLGGTKADIGLAVDGELTVASRIATHAADGAEQVLGRVLAEARRLAGDRRVAALGLATPGVVEGTQVRQAPNLPGLEGLDVGRVVAAGLPGARLRVLNDLNAAAMALAEDDDGDEALLVVGLGTGIAAGVVLDGRLWEGANSGGGEIGEAPVPRPDGSGVAPLETIVGGRAFDRLAAEVGLPDARSLLDAARTPRLREQVLPRLELLAGAVALACRVVDPRRVVLFGGLAGHPLVRGHVEAALAPHVAGGLSVRWVEGAERPALRGALRAATAEAARS